MTDKDYLYPFSNCGCGGGNEPDEEEIKRVVREAEEDDTPILVPITDPHGIPEVNWPTRKRVLVEVE